jgi:cytoskeletal protein RodZ
MKLISIQYSRLMVLSGLLCLIMLCASNSQNSVFAQNGKSITPDLKTFFNDAIFPNSSPSTDFSNVDDRSHGSKVGSDAQGHIKTEDETTTAPQVDETTTAPQVDETTTAPQVDETTTAAEEEVEVTMKQTNEALVESGIFGLGF